MDLWTRWHWFRNCSVHCTGPRSLHQHRLVCSWKRAPSDKHQSIEIPSGRRWGRVPALSHSWLSLMSKWLLIELRLMLQRKNSIAVHLKLALLSYFINYFNSCLPLICFNFVPQKTGWPSIHWKDFGYSLAVSMILLNALIFYLMSKEDLSKINFICT